MSNNGKWLGFSLLLLTFLVVPASGQAPESKPDDQMKQLTVLVIKLQQSIDDLKKQLESTPTEVSVDIQIRKALASTQAELFALRKQVEQLQRDVDALRGPRVAKTIDPVASGRIRLVNTYFTPMTIIVNDRSVRLAPGATETIDIPAGEFSFEVLGVQPRLYGRTVAANETYTITVYPR